MKSKNEGGDGQLDGKSEEDTQACERYATSSSKQDIQKDRMITRQ